MRSLFCIDNRQIFDYLCKIEFSEYNKKQAALNLSVLNAGRRWNTKSLITSNNGVTKTANLNKFPVKEALLVNMAA